MAWLWRCLAPGEQTDKDQQIQPGLAHPRQTTQDSPEPCMRLGTDRFLLNRLLDGWPDVRERGASFLDFELTETFIHSMWSGSTDKCINIADQDNGRSTH